MKILRHPVHIMLIHFPAALFPMELICYFVYYKSGDASFASASYYAMCGGVLMGLLAVITGAIDLVMIKNNSAVQAKALIHGSINSIVVITYGMLACMLYKKYPGLPLATMPMLALKVALNITMIAGNYLGGNLILKYKIGVQNT